MLYDIKLNFCALDTFLPYILGCNCVYVALKLHHYSCHVIIKGLKQLEYLNLNFCQQLTGNICNYIRHCRHLEVLQLSGLDKLNDGSIEMLLSDPMDHLTELDISHTAITDRSLEAIAKG